MLRGLICLLFASLLPINFVQAAPLVEKSFYPKFDAGSTAPEAVTGAIEALVHEHARRWTPKVWRSTLELWDRSEPAPYILLVHQPDWLIGWEQIDGYFAKKPNLPVKEIPDQAPAGMQQIEKIHYEYRSEWEMRAMQYTPSGIRVRLIDKDLAMAVWYVDFQYKPSFMPARGEPWIGS